MTIKAPPPVTAAKTKIVVAPAPVAAPASHTTTYVATTVQAAVKTKIVTTNPVVGKAKY